LSKTRGCNAYDKILQKSFDVLIMRDVTDVLPEFLAKYFGAACKPLIFIRFQGIDRQAFT